MNIIDAKSSSLALAILSACAMSFAEPAAYVEFIGLLKLLVPAFLGTSLVEAGTAKAVEYAKMRKEAK